MSRSSSSGGGVGIGMILFIVFLILKLTGNIDWSWWWVTSPLWIPPVAIVLFLIAIGVVYLLYLIVKAIFGKEKYPRYPRF